MIASSSAKTRGYVAESSKLFLSTKGCFGLNNNCFWSCTVNKRGSFRLNVLFTFLYLFCRRLLYFTSVSFSSALEYAADRKSPYRSTRLSWWQRCQINKWNNILKQNRPTRPWWFHKQSLLTKQGKTYLKCKSLSLVMTRVCFHNVVNIHQILRRCTAIAQVP